MKFKDFIKDSDLTPENGRKIAERLNIMYNGIQKEMDSYVFTDKKYKATFYAKNFSHAVKKLREKREEFRKARKDK